MLHVKGKQTLDKLILTSYKIVSPSLQIGAAEPCGARGSVTTALKSRGQQQGRVLQHALYSITSIVTKRAFQGKY